MRRRRAPISRTKLWIGGVAILAATATAGVAAAGMAADGSAGDSAAIQAAETFEPPADPTPSAEPSTSAPAPPTATARPRLPGGAPQAAGGQQPSPKPSSASPSPRRKTSAPSSGTGDAEQQVLARINAARADAGLGPVTMSAPLVAAAHAHNLEMAGGCGLSHQCGGEAGLGDRISAQGTSWSRVAENVGTGGPVDNSESAQADMAVGLTNSMLAEVPPDDGHRKNILNPELSRIGIDVIREADGTVWLTHDFAN
ncbi:CAP domain-containing protein [Cryptosporangium aurantiacum]|uniref:Uncharacterized conserved protein YkwD, contains CAP (CSP/antigen 5/PR1) domain n=1 Tax=Cryptosporangium aurantiacum TaxID=134849 RepID=A0A1M7MAL6_9ACTN|nr:CAP domain-containing protein [Cryptosporangium aurantiacum]SHM87747.1 Uncharacterized conserved protein YkwD, contains CAP (CSP/antigen 5/PR1) domain [Cryptosporangium aurantiacum]